MGGGHKEEGGYRVRLGQLDLQGLPPEGPADWGGLGGSQARTMQGLALELIGGPQWVPPPPSLGVGKELGSGFPYPPWAGPQEAMCLATDESLSGQGGPYFCVL